MLPMPPQSVPQEQPMPMESGAPQGEMTLEQAQQLIMEALSQLKAVANQYGLDLQSLLQQVQ